MKQKTWRKVVLGLTVFAQVFYGANAVRAEAAGSVVINEIAWAGSADSASDEWIELYNTTGGAIDVNGWTINDDQGASTYLLSGSIPAYGYYLIEDSEAAVQPNMADAVVNLSLANTGDSLVLFDAAGQMIDAVNSSGGAWFAGNATTQASMERKNALVSGDDAGNWVSGNGSGSTAVSSGGSGIPGTPGMLNSQSLPSVLPQKVTLTLSSAEPAVGDMLTVTANVSNASDLFSYGFEILYDPAVLTYSSATAGDFLGEGGSVPTSFQAGLENAGKLLVADARTQDVKTGVNGSGALFTLQFDVAGGAGSVSSISFGPSSFTASTMGDEPAQFENSSFTLKSVQADPVLNAQVVAGAERYSLKIEWNAPPTGADSYKVYRRDAHGNFVPLGGTTQLNFVDADGAAAGGEIIPLVDYAYRVAAVKDSIESPSLEVTGKELRGLKGDNDRSDRVDGRDLDKLARHFAESDADVSFDPLADTTYDGLVDGSDLIDLGMNFARRYAP